MNPSVSFMCNIGKAVSLSYQYFEHTEKKKIMKTIPPLEKYHTLQKHIAGLKTVFSL
jgi:hypothetical protein